MTMSVDPGVMDANILAYAVDADAPQHTASRSLLDAASDPSVTLYVTSQILCEFYSIITNPRRVRVVSSSAQALSIISAMLALPGLYVLPTPARAVAGWCNCYSVTPSPVETYSICKSWRPCRPTGFSEFTLQRRRLQSVSRTSGSDAVSPVFLSGAKRRTNFSGSFPYSHALAHRAPERRARVDALFA